jgi:hypothetical protein
MGGSLRLVVVLLVLFFIVFSGTCCILQHKSKQPAIWLSEPIKKIVWIDASFSEEEKNDIVRAYKKLECSTNHSIVQFEFVTNASVADYYQMKISPSIVVMNVDSKDPRIRLSDKRLAKENKGKQTAGLFLSQEEIPTVLLPRDRLVRSTFYEVALHEAIHSSLNILDHSESKKAVMFYAMDETSARDISKDDLKFICEYYQCDAESFNVCVGE